MPRLSVWLVRAALIFLVAGVTAGALMLAGRGLGVAGRLAWLLPIHAEFLLMGWTVQLVLGVAYWILPAAPTGAERGGPSITWAAFVAFNTGVLLASLAGAIGASTFLVLAGRLLEAMAAAALVIQAWPRIRRPQSTSMSPSPGTRLAGGARPYPRLEGPDSLGRPGPRYVLGAWSPGSQVAVW